MPLLFIILYFRTPSQCLAWQITTFYLCRFIWLPLLEHGQSHEKSIDVDFAEISCAAWVKISAGFENHCLLPLLSLTKLQCTAFIVGFYFKLFRKIVQLAVLLGDYTANCGEILQRQMDYCRQGDGRLAAAQLGMNQLLIPVGLAVESDLRQNILWALQLQRIYSCRCIVKLRHDIHFLQCSAWIEDVKKFHKVLVLILLSERSQVGARDVRVLENIKVQENMRVREQCFSVHTTSEHNKFKQTWLKQFHCPQGLLVY